MSMFGMLLSLSSGNNIYCNNIINNNFTYVINVSANTWNSPSEITYIYNGTRKTNYLGNYWDDYGVKYPDAEELDATGFWNIPYEIDGDSDDYPRMEPFENYIT
jgi:hypothetical protein